MTWIPPKASSRYFRFPVVEACRFHLSGGLVYPAVQVVVVVKKEIAGSLALAHKQGRLRIALQMVAIETCKVNIRQNIRVVHQKRSCPSRKGRAFLMPPPVSSSMPRSSLM